MVRKIARKPYLAFYHDFKTHELKSTRRRPPLKEHDLEPSDQVELLSTKNADWQKGDLYEVKRLAHKNSNLVQITNEDKETTFINADQLKIEAKGARSAPKDPRYGLYWSEYLTWP